MAKEIKYGIEARKALEEGVNIVSVDSKDSTELTSGGAVSGKKRDFAFRANASTGTAIVDFLFTYKFGNNLTIKFSDLYKEYFDGLSEDQKNHLYNLYGESSKNKYVQFDVQSIPNGVSVYRESDRNPLAENDTVAVLDFGLVDIR